MEQSPPDLGFLTIDSMQVDGNHLSNEKLLTGIYPASIQRNVLNCHLERLSPCAMHRAAYA